MSAGMEKPGRIEIRKSRNGLILPVKVVPGASRNIISGILGNRLKIKTVSPPERGAANRQALKIISEALEIPAGYIRVKSGITSSMKELEIRGLSAGELMNRLSRVQIKAKKIR